MKQTGLDYVIVDLEHSPVGPGTAAELVAAANDAGLGTLVRINAISRGQILKMLDAGAMGLIVPQVNTADEVRELVSYAKFAPLGNRGYCPTADGGWGFSDDYAAGMPGYMAQANERTLVIPQCETTEALADIENIAAMEGVDGIFIGPFDLSISMGLPGAFEEQRFKAALTRIQQACRQAGKPCLIFAGDGAAAGVRLAQGFDGVAIGLDATMLIAGVRAQLAACRG